MQSTSIAVPSLLLKIRRILIHFIQHPGFYREMLFFIASTATVSGTGFIYWKLITVLYPPELVGGASIALSTALFLAGIANLGLPTAIVRFIPQADPQQKSMFITFAHLISMTMTLTLSIIFLLGRSLWSPNFLKVPFAEGYAVSFVALTLVSGTNNIHESVLQAERHSPALFVKALCLSLSRLFALIIMPVAGGTLSVLGSTLFPTTVLSAVLFWGIPRYFHLVNGHLNFDFVAIRSMLNYSLGNQLFNFLWSIPSFAFPLLIFNVLGAKANAYFAVVWLFVNLMLIIPNSISLTLLVEGSHDQQNLSRTIQSSLKTNMLLLIPLACTLFFAAPYILGFFGSSYAENGVGMLRLFAFATLPSAINSVYLTSKQVTKQIKLLNWITFIMIGLSVGLGVLLVRYQGLIGIGWGWLIGQSLVACTLIIPLRLGSAPLVKHLMQNADG